MKLSELRLDTRFLTSTTTDDYSNTDLDRNLNRHYDSFTSFVWENQDTWQFDDSQKGTQPVARTNLEAGRDEYAIPTDARAVQRVEVKNSAGNYIKLSRLRETKVRTSMDLKQGDTSSMPREFVLKGRSIILYPAPSATETTLIAGLQIYVSRSVTLLSDADDEPGFDREFHRILSIGAAMDWAIANQVSDKRNSLEREIEKLLIRARTFYGSRDATTATTLTPKLENYDS